MAMATSQHFMTTAIELSQPKEKGWKQTNAAKPPWGYEG